MESNTYHEPLDLLSVETRDMHRAIVSLMEELEAIDWYQQRAVLLSHRGGDFQLTVGQDLSIGYTGHDKETVHLYLTESFTFRVLDRTAAVYLKPKRGKK